MTLAMALSRYGGAACFAEPQDAIDACRESLAIFQSLAQTDLDKRVIEVDVGAALHTLGTALSDSGKLDDGLAMRRQAVEYFETLHAKRPDDFDVTQWLGASHGQLGKSLLLLGRYDEAERELLESKRVYAELNRVFPSVVTRKSVSSIDSIIGDVRAKKNDFARAAEAYATSVDELEALVREDPQDMQARMDFGMNLHRLAELQALAGDNDAAIKTFETRFMPMVQKRYKPGDAKLIGYQLEHAALLQRAGRSADAEALLLECERDARANASSKLPDVIQHQVELYEQTNQRDLADQARQRLAKATSPSTQPQD
jgi:tetratricopeptide (TPR) repeat protein